MFVRICVEFSIELFTHQLLKLRCDGLELTQRLVLLYGVFGVFLILLNENHRFDFPILYYFDGAQGCGLVVLINDYRKLALDVCFFSRFY